MSMARMLEMVKPDGRAPRATIMAWIKAHFKMRQWGVIRGENGSPDLIMDCDRCHAYLASGNRYPCDQCKKWDHLIAEYRKRNRGNGRQISRSQK